MLLVRAHLQLYDAASTVSSQALEGLFLRGQMRLGTAILSHDIAGNRHVSNVQLQVREVAGTSKRKHCKSGPRNPVKETSGARGQESIQ